MKKIIYFILIVLSCALVLVGCNSTPTTQEENEQRVNECADSLYLVYWGDGFNAVELPEALVTSRNEFDDSYLERDNKVIFITMDGRSTNLSSADVEELKLRMSEGFSVYFYSYSVLNVLSLEDVFSVSTTSKLTDIANGSEADYMKQSNYIGKFTIDENSEITSSVEYSAQGSAKLEEKAILYTVLERNTH